MRILGLDIGTRTIGVAVSDSTALIATGLETIRRTVPDKDYKRLDELVSNYKVERIVIGYPKNMDGTVGERGHACEIVVEKLKLRYPFCQVVLWDERLSTVAAQRILIEADLSRAKRKKVVDIVAATVILQNYLDSCH